MGLHESSTGEKISLAKKSVTKENGLKENPQMGHDALHEGGILMGNNTDSWPSSFQ